MHRRRETTREYLNHIWWMIENKEAVEQFIEIYHGLREQITDDEQLLDDSIHFNFLRLEAERLQRIADVA